MPPAPVVQTNDVGRFQFFYAPFPADADNFSNSEGSAFATRASRLFMVDTKLGKVWAYQPEWSGVASNGVGLLKHEGFTPIAVTNDAKALFDREISSKGSAGHQP
jgi:hypothetical protein